MRILHLVHQYPPAQRGGTEYYTQHLATAQAAEGHAVAVFVPVEGVSGVAPAAQQEQGVEVYRVPVGARSRSQVFWHTFRQPALRAAWAEFVGRFQPDIVHIQHLMGLPLAVVETLRAAGTPYVVTLHDYWYLCANAQLFTNTDSTICAGPDDQAGNCARCALARGGLPDLGGFAGLLAPVMRRRNAAARAVLSGAQRVIAPTKFVRDIYAGLGVDPAQMIIVPHGIDLPQEAIAAAQQDRVPPVPGRPLRIGYVGSVGYQKGVHVLLEAFAGLPEGRASLTIFGSLDDFPAYAAGLQAQAAPGVTFAGRVAREDLWTALAALDVVVLPTLWYEVSPLVIDEVFAVGVPIMASRVGAMTEKIREGENGRFFPPGDAAALAALLRDLLADPRQLAQLGRGAPAVQPVAAHMKAIEEVYAAAQDSV